MQIINFNLFISLTIGLIISLFFNLFDIVVVYIFVLLFHEFVHFWVARKLGYKFEKIVFMPYGTMLYGKNSIVIDKHEIYIAISAPLVNILTSFIFMGIWWIFPETYEYTFNFVSANISLGFFNLLPLLPLDGGRIVLAYMKNKYKIKKVYLIFICLTLLFIILFIIFFIKSLYSTPNLTCLFIVVFLALSLLDYRSNKFSKLKFNEKDFSKVKVLRIKQYMVDYKESLINLVKYIKDDYYCKFVFLREGKVYKILTETELIGLLKNRQHK